LLKCDFPSKAHQERTPGNLAGKMLHSPHATNIQWIHSIGSLPCGKAAGTLSCEKYTATPSFSPGTGVYKMYTKSLVMPY